MCIGAIDNALTTVSKFWEKVKVPASIMILATETGVMTGLEWASKIQVRKIDHVCCQVFSSDCWRYNATLNLLFNTHNITTTLCQESIPEKIREYLVATCVCGTASSLLLLTTAVAAWKVYQRWGYVEIPDLELRVLEEIQEQREQAMTLSKEKQEKKVDRMLESHGKSVNVATEQIV